MGFAPLKSQLLDVAFRLPLPLRPCTGMVDTCLQQHVRSSLGSPLGRAPGLLPGLRRESRRWLHRLLRHPYYRCRCIQLRFYLFPIPVFREFHFSLSSPAPPLRQHQIKKPITLPHPKKAFEKGGRHGFNVLKLQNCKPQTSKRVGYSWGLLALWKQLSGHRRLWGARRL